MNMMPLFHVGGIVRNLWSPVFSAGSAIMCAGFDANAWWPLAKQLGATDADSLPNNTEIEAELRAWQALYQDDEQPGP